jgi:hypothetical protein
MKWNGSAWVSVGPSNFSAVGAAYSSLSLDSNNNIYVAFSDGGENGKVSVMKWNGSNWINHGTAGFSDGQASYISLAIDSGDVPYVAYQDHANALKVTVKKWNDPNWVTVGTQGFSQLQSDWVSLAIDSTRAPYVVYQHGVDGKGKVERFDSEHNIWENLGVNDEPFSIGSAYFISLAIDSNNNPYVAYRDSSESFKASAMKWNGANWENLGSLGFSSGQAYSTKISIDSNNTPYVGYYDQSSADKVTVKRFNGYGNWENLSPSGGFAGPTQQTTLAINPSNIPYVAYIDIPENNKATVMKFNIPSIEYEGSFTESVQNNGSVTGSIIATISNDTFINDGGVLTEGLHYTLQNKPSGLTSLMQVSGNGTIATLSFSGNATLNNLSNSVNNLTIDFVDGAFSNTAEATHVVNPHLTSGVINFNNNTASPSSGGHGASSFTISTNLLPTVVDKKNQENLKPAPLPLPKPKPFIPPSKIVLTSKDLIINLQVFLRDQNIAISKKVEPDGVFGPTTKKALSQWEDLTNKKANILFSREMRDFIELLE